MTVMIVTIRATKEDEGRPGFVNLEAPYLEHKGDIKTGLAYLKISNRDTRNDRIWSETGCFMNAIECELLADNLLKSAQIMRQEESR